MGRPRDDRQKDLLRPALDQIVDLGHPLVRLAEKIDWTFLDDLGAGGALSTRHVGARRERHDVGRSPSVRISAQAAASSASIPRFASLALARVAGGQP